jgi:hypothetical protein
MTYVGDVEDLDGDQLAQALEVAAVNCSWETRAAIGLIVAQRSWLYRWEFRQAVEVDVDDDGSLCAWVDWSEVDMTAPASSGELRILEIARSLGGIPSGRPLSDLLTSLDDQNLARVIAAVEVAARGYQGAPW